MTRRTQTEGSARSGADYVARRSEAMRTSGERHELCRPASPAAIIAKALADSGRDAEWLRQKCGFSKRFMADLMADREVPSIFETLAIGQALNRRDLKLVAAAVECERWDREEDEMAWPRKRRR